MSHCHHAVLSLTGIMASAALSPSEPVECRPDTLARAETTDTVTLLTPRNIQSPVTAFCHSFPGGPATSPPTSCSSSQPSTQLGGYCSKFDAVDSQPRLTQPTPDDKQESLNTRANIYINHPRSTVHSFGIARLVINLSSPA